MPLQEDERVVTIRVLQWGLFAVCLGVSSIVLRWSLSAVAGRPATMDHLLADGELFVVAVAIAGAALSDIVTARAHDGVRHAVTFVAVISIMLGGALYALQQNDVPAPESNVKIASTLIFLAAAIAGGAAILLKED